MEENVIVKASMGFKNVYNFIMILLGIAAAFPLITAIYYEDDMLIVPGICIILAYILACVIFYGCLITELIVTTKRVASVGAFDHRIDIPIEQITSIKSIFFNTIVVSSAAGKLYCDTAAPS